MIDDMTFEELEDQRLTAALNDVAFRKTVPSALAVKVAMARGNGGSARRHLPRWALMAASLVAMMGLAFAATSVIVMRAGVTTETPLTSSPSHPLNFSTAKEAQTMNIKQKVSLAAAAVTVAGLAPPAAAGVASATSSAMASFSSFVANSAQAPTALEGGFHSFVSQSVVTDTLQQFNSREPRGTKIILR